MLLPQSQVLLAQIGGKAARFAGRLTHAKQVFTLRGI
jgi:hypothetical protein